MKRTWSTAIIAAAAFQVIGCASAPSEVRSATAPHKFQTARSYDAFVGCIADRVITKFKMQTFPTERGTSFIYDFGNQGFGKSVLLVDIMRGDPVTAEVFIKGGPWLGRDNLLLEIVDACAKG